MIFVLLLLSFHHWSHFAQDFSTLPHGRRIGWLFTHTHTHCMQYNTEHGTTQRLYSGAKGRKDSTDKLCCGKPCLGLARGWLDHACKQGTHLTSVGHLPPCHVPLATKSSFGFFPLPSQFSARSACLEDGWMDRRMDGMERNGCTAQIDICFFLILVRSV